MMFASRKIRLVSAGLALTFVGSTVADTAMAQRYNERDRYIERYYRDNGRDSDYREWRRGRWDERDYRRWYRRHHRDNDRNAGLAAIFGLAAGAILGGAVTQGMTGSVATSAVPPAGGYAPGTQGYLRYCSNKYRSFDPASGTYLGYDGNRHYCQ